MVFYDYYLQIVEQNKLYPKCDCKMTGKLRLSSSDDNPKRRFLNCSIVEIMQMVKWVDDELSRHYKAEVLSLMGEVKTQKTDLEEIPKLKQLSELKAESEAKLDVVVHRIIELEDELVNYKKKDDRRRYKRWLMVVFVVLLAIGWLLV